MTEDKEGKLSLGKNDSGEGNSDGFDVSPVINNIMGYMDEDKEGFFGSLLKKNKQPAAAEEAAAEEAFAPHEEAGDGAPVIGGGFVRDNEAAAQTENLFEAPAAENVSAGEGAYPQPQETAPEEDFEGAVIGGEYEDGSGEEFFPANEAAAEAFPEPAEEEEQEEEEGLQPEYTPDENNSGSAFTMRTLDDRNKSKAPTKQPEYIERGDEDRIAASIAKLKSGLTVRAVLLFFSTIFSIFITTANDLELPLAAVFDRTVNPSAYLFTNTILGIVSIGFAYSMVIMGIKNLVKLKPDSDSLAAMNILAACIAGLVTLFDPESLKASFFHLYTAAAILGMFVNTLCKLSVATRAERNFKLLRSTKSVYALRHENEETTAYLTNNKTEGQGEIALMRKTDFVRDFIKNSYSSDLSDLFAEKTAPLILGVAIAAGVLSLIFDTHAVAIQEKIFVFLASVSGALSLCSSFSLTAVVNIPLASAGRKVLSQNGALLGYSSVEDYANSGNVLFDAEQLFPKGSIHFSNMKVLDVISVDHTVLYSASLAKAGRLFSLPAFEKMLGGTLEGLYAVRGFVEEDGEGVSGTIAGKKMLLGSRELMKRNKIEGLPPIAAEENFASDGCVMYLAVFGRAAAMFNLRPEADSETGDSLKALQNEGVEVYVRCPDGILTRDYIAKLYGLRPEKIHMLRPRAEGDTSWLTAPAESLSASMFCSGDISAFALLIAEARRVKFAANLGVAIQYGQMLLGGVITVLMMLSGRFGLVTPTLSIVFGLVFFAATMLVQKIKS